MKAIYKRFTKSVLFTIFLIHLTFLGFAATYYVSSSGSDLNSGLSTTTPWKTLEKVNASAFVAGDQILFQRGDTFYGSLTIKNSGSSISRIVYGAYGTGMDPIITGFTTVTAWTNLGSNIWESTSAVSTLTDLNMVVINDVNTGMGRTPNTGYYNYQAHTSGTISSSNLTGTPNWTGAECAFNSVPYIISRLKITGQSGSAIWLNGNTGIIWDNQQFIIQDDPRTLDVQNEWYYNPSTKKLKIYSTSQPANVKVSTVDQLINVGASYITLENLSITGSNARSINVGASYITIQNCNITYNGTDAIDGTWNVTGSNILITNCTINESNHGGIAFTRFFSDVTISSNTITNSAMIYGASAKAIMSNNATINYGISVHSANSLIESNHVENSGYIGISTYGMVNQVIQKNFVKTFCIHSHDGGGIYTWNGTVKTAINTGMKILNNIVVGNTADGTTGDADSNAGIYLDDFSNSVEIADNTIIGNQFGIFLHDTHDIIVQRNTTFDNDKGFRIYGEVGITMNNISNNNNIYLSKRTGQMAMHIDPLEAVLPTFTGSNNMYARPINDTYTIGAYIRTPTFSSFAKSVAEWKTYSGQDANSLKSPQIITNENDLTIEYNATKTIKTVTLSQPMIDVKGAKYAGSLTLQPFTSLILMKDISAASVPEAPTSLVAIAGNASASLTFTAPASNGGSVITGYTVTSNPTGGVDASAGSTSLIRTITGLTNGTAYTFTVNASNSTGTSVASAPSNSVTPQAPIIATATAFTFTGSNSGNVKSASANFTVTPNNLYTGTITITPTGTGSTGLTAIVLTFSNSSAAQSFTITPSVAGSITLTPTNNGILTNAANLVYTANAVEPDAPISLVATAGNASATATFDAPTNNGGTVITGYTITSIPSGGTDIHAGSTSNTHTITGLTNGTAYTFTVKATNSAGTSVASASSNSVVPIAPPANIPSVDSHFKTVWQGENGHNHMNIIVLSAMLDDISLTTDDEIAIFSGSLCVGANKITRSINSADNSTYITIPTSQNDGTNNGFTANDTIIFKIWDNKNQKELVVDNVKYSNNIPSWTTSGSYLAGATSAVEIEAFTQYYQTIELKKGYNLFSSYLTPSDPNVSSVTKSLLADGNLIKMQDESGNSLENWGNFGGWINKIGSIEKTEGYKIQVANSCSFQVVGRPIVLPLDIPLRTGWNIISFPSAVMVDAKTAIQSLIDQNKLIKVQDEEGNSIENWGNFGGWKNGIGNFMPGKAYKVKMSADAVLTYQQNYLKSATIMANSEKTVYFSSMVVGNGSDHMNINLLGFNGSGLSIGDELAAFDGEICVGTLKITADHLSKGTGSLIVSSATNDKSMDGFTVGNPILIYSWNQISGNESKVQTEILNGKLNYDKNSTVLVQLKSLTTKAKSIDDILKLDVFPNPSQGKFTVRFSQLPDSGSRIEILDISGRKVATRLISGSSEEFNLDNQPGGLYIVKSILGSDEIIRKLIINK